MRVGVRRLLVTILLILLTTGFHQLRNEVLDQNPKTTRFWSHSERES